MSGPGSPRRQALIGAIVCFGSFAVLFLLATAARGTLTDFDRVLGRAPYRFADQHAWVEHLAAFTEDVTVPDNLAVIGVVVAVALAISGRRRSAIFAGVVPLLARELYPLLKDLVERPRPVHTDPLHPIGGWSFPSGHATVFGAAIWAAMVLTVTLVGDPLLRRRILVGLSVLAGAVAFDRLLLGVHYFSDVLAGLLLAGAIALGAAAAIDPYRDGYRAARGPDADPG